MQRLFAKKEKDVRQYLRNDRKVLRFYAVSELPYYPLGCKGEQKYVIHYYLSDDTLEVRELRSLEEPKGAGTFPKFLKRQKVPKGPASRPKSKIRHNTEKYIIVTHIVRKLHKMSHFGIVHHFLYY